MTQPQGTEVMGDWAAIVTKRYQLGSDCAGCRTALRETIVWELRIFAASQNLVTYFSGANTQQPQNSMLYLESKRMNDNTHFSYQQVLDSIEEMRASLRPDSASVGGGDWDSSTPFWEEGVSQSTMWFEDCEFDPRGRLEE